MTVSFVRVVVLALSLVLSASAGEARATLFNGVVSGVVYSASYNPDLGFFEDGLANGGGPITVRFSLDTSLTPPGSDVSEFGAHYEESLPATPWLTADLEVNGHTVPIDPGYLLFESFHDVATGGYDSIHFLVSTFGLPEDPMDVEVVAQSDDFHAGPWPWTDLEVTPNFYSPGTFSHLISDESGYGITFNVTHLSLHAVPEPSAALLLLLGAASCWRRRAR